MSRQNSAFNRASAFQLHHRLPDPIPPETRNAWASATCSRERCNRPLYRILENRTLRLCQHHYEKRLQNQAKKQLPPEPRHCLYCGNEIQNPRNKSFCNHECHASALRIINDPYAVAVLKHSWWRNTESLIRRSSIGLDSVPDPSTDIPGLIRLHALKAHYQNSFNTVDGEWLTDAVTHLPVVKLKSSIEVQLCHRYPNAQGGANTPLNFVIAPPYTNLPLQSRCPPHNADERLNGIRVDSTGKPLEGSLISALKARYGADHTRQIMQKINAPRASKLKAYPHRPPDFAPLYRILVMECRRLGFRHLASQLDTLFKRCADALGLHLELLASAFFIALQTQDADGLITTMEQLTLDESSRLVEQPADLNIRNRNLRLPLAIYEGSPVYTLLCAAKTVLQKYLKVDIFETIQTRFLVLYNKTFYQPPVMGYSPLECVLLDNPRHKEHPAHRQWTKSHQLKRKGTKRRRQQQWQHQIISESIKQTQTRSSG